MQVRKAQPEEFPRIWEITLQAKEQLKSLGLDQWQNGYPSREIWTEDLKEGMAYVAEEAGQILGVFAFQVTPDSSYGEIQGKWLTDQPYAAMHRVCVADGCRGKGVAGQMFAAGFEMARSLGFSSLRIDTHPENLPMQHALKKAGFAACGTIHLVGGCEDGKARIGFERLL